MLFHYNHKLKLRILSFFILECSWTENIPVAFIYFYHFNVYQHKGPFYNNERVNGRKQGVGGAVGAIEYKTWV